MAAAGVRTRPLIAVVSRVPLFVEAVAGAFAGIADVQAISADDVEARGLVRAFRPDAVIVEGLAVEVDAFLAPCFFVDLQTQRLSERDATEWRELELELSPEAIRNTVIAVLYGGEAA